jgi:class 3 adenylate cyclase
VGLNMGSSGWDPTFRRSEVRYAHIGEESVAYRVMEGTRGGAHDVVLLLSGTASMESLFEDPVGVRLFEGLADLGRLVVFDRRGIGLSDPPAHATGSGITRWREDLDAVVAAADVIQPVVVSSMLSASAAFLYCDVHPDDVTALVMFEPSPPVLIDRRAVRGQVEGTIDSVAVLCPSRADEPGFREWFTRAGQMGASPLRAADAYPIPTDDDKRDVESAASRTRVRTLVLRRPGHAFSPDRSSDPVVALVTDAVRVDLPGDDLLIFGGEVDALVAEVSRFVTGEHRLPEPERVVAAVLFSDLVASTERASAVGDARWRRLLDRHDAAIRGCVGRRGGTVVKTTGDGVLARLPSAGDAIRAGQELRTALAHEGLVVRVGIHVGDIDLRSDDISGVAVAIAARITNLAGPGEILMSSTAVAAAAGQPLRIEPRGRRTLKGIPESWDVYAVSSPPGQ